MSRSAYEHKAGDVIPTDNTMTYTLPTVTEHNKENWANLKGEYLCQPILGGDGRVLVHIDGYKSKYSCTACEGKGHTGELCPRCNGTKLSFDGIAKSPCNACAVGESDGVKRYGFKLCEQCKGRQGTIIIPEINEKNTDSGTVLAVSSTGVNKVKVNDKVLIGTYTGVPFKFLDLDLKVIVEKDLLGIIKQLKKSTDGLNQGTYADLENVGVARE